jgi:murein DD-endopeptidase MepM/ murein hydrolase activator NlpD
MSGRAVRLVRTIASLFLLSCGSNTPRILSEYGTRTGVEGVLNVRRQPHPGVDLEATSGDAVLAARAGVVEWVYESSLSGVNVAIRHDDSTRFWTSYSHLSWTRLQRGDAVLRGAVIGGVGLTKNSGGVVHLHWEYCRDRGCHVTEDPLTLRPRCLSNATEAGTVFPLRC